MIASRDPKLITVFDGKTDTGASSVVIKCTDHRNIIFSIGTASSANMTIKCQGALGNSVPDFGSAASATNQWDYVQMIDLEDGAPIDGDTGVVYSGTDGVRLLEVNTNGIDYVTLNVTAVSAGSVTAKARLVSNQ